MRILLLIFLFLPMVGFSQNCEIKETAPEQDFNYKLQFARYETGWYDEWLA
jgi:hypothetical protein